MSRFYSVLTKCFVFSLSLSVLSAFASEPKLSLDHKHGAILKFSDGRVLSELDSINQALKTVGVSLERIAVPKSAVPILESALDAPLSAADTQRLLALFALEKQQVVEQALKSNRQPVIPDGGSLTTGEPGVAPYPKIYDLKAMDANDRLGARNKFGRLHVNATDAMLGVDEVMTLPVGGAWTWYFQIDGQAVELHMSKVSPGEPAWRLNYPGTTPHGAYFHATEGLCIAYITGPESWKMRYQAPKLENTEHLGTNPFINFGTHSEDEKKTNEESLAVVDISESAFSS